MPKRGLPPPSKLRFVSWNVLSPNNLQNNPYLYTSCHPGTLPWQQRQPRIIDSILRLDADIVALQEVEEFHQNFEEPLRYLGYDGIYKQRTGGQPDGVALLWRNSRLSLMHVEHLEYAHALTRDVTDPAESERLRKHNVGLVGVFYDRLAQREIVVATTHLLFNPKRGVVKVRQLQHLLMRVDALRRLSLERNGNTGEAASSAGCTARGSIAAGSSTTDSPLPSLAASSAAPPSPPPSTNQCVSTGAVARASVILGDFNCTPSSLLHAFVRSGQLVAPTHAEGEWDGHEAEVRGARAVHARHPAYTHAPSMPACVSAGAAASSGLHAGSAHRPHAGSPHMDASHPLAGELLSAYGNGRGEPEATTFHKKFLGTVDYVWYTAQHLEVRTVLPTPSRRELIASHSLPDWRTPSDHVPIGCDLEWRPKERMPAPYRRDEHGTASTSTTGATAADEDVANCGTHGNSHSSVDVY